VPLVGAYGLNTVAAPQARVDPSIGGEPLEASLEIWLDLNRPPLAEARSLPPDQRDAAIRALDAQQAAVLGRVRALGGHELARVRVVRNALAVSVPAGRLYEVAAIDGVVRVRAVRHAMRVLPAASAATGKPGR
jgi:hypothetical protein